MSDMFFEFDDCAAANVAGGAINIGLLGQFLNQSNFALSLPTVGGGFSPLSVSPSALLGGNVSQLNAGSLTGAVVGAAYI